MRGDRGPSSWPRNVPRSPSRRPSVADAGTCTYQPCRHFERKVSRDDVQFCRHGQRCPLALSEPENDTPPRVTPGRAAGVAIVLALVAVLSIVSQRTTQPPTSSPQANGSQVPAVDYDREVAELVAFSRQVLEKTHAITVFEAQIHTKVAPLHGEDLDRWVAAADRKKTERADLCSHMVKKLGSLFRSDQGSIDRAFESFRDGLEIGDSDERSYKSVSLAQTQWERLRATGHLSSLHVIAGAQALMPLGSGSETQ